MANSKPNRSKLSKWWDELVAPQEWEAPDRDFIGHRDILTHSLSRYQFAANYVFGSSLEIGVGRGYGLDLYREYVDKWVGVDLSYSFLENAKSMYQELFVQSTGNFLPFPKKSFDSIITFEVIEHIEDDIGYLNEISRVLRNNGVLVISTPNKIAVSGDRNIPLDRFHIREYLFPEFLNLLKQVFNEVDVYSQFEKTDQRGKRSKWMDRIPIFLRSSLPAKFQGRISSLIREPLNLTDCKFVKADLPFAQNFLAICRK